MRIKKMTSQHRRDFQAEYECEHCGDVTKGHGYDDNNFHQNVIPSMVCKNCNQKSPETYTPQKTKYEAWQTV